MFRGLPTSSLPLVSLFAEPYLFAVPSYQRPYSWTIKEATQLLEDVLLAAGLEEAEPAMPDYFLGAILLLESETPPQSLTGHRIYEVVDGQQRLVTLAILLSVLRDFCDQDRHPATDAQLADRLNAMVQGAMEPTQRIRIQLREVEQDYLEAHVCARHPAPSADADGTGSSGIRTVHAKFIYELEGMTRTERERLARYLIEECHVVVIMTRDIDGAHRLFTVLNERGKPLDKKDILKAEVLRALPDAKASTAHAQWEQAHVNLGPELEHLFSYIRLTHTSGRVPIIASMRGLVRDYGSTEFMQQIVTPLADALHTVRTFDGNPVIAQNRALHGALLSLNRLAKSDWVPAAMLAMTHFEDDPVASAAVLIEIERFAFLLRLLNLGADKRQRRFAPVIAAVQEAPERAAFSPAFEITRDEQKMISHHLKDLHHRNASLAKLLLMRIEGELAGQPVRTDPSELTVEHVLPLRPAQTSEWRRNFPDGDIREVCQSSLGNLALITTRQNDRAKNKDFAAKIAMYRETEPGDPVIASNAAILAAGTWREEHVRQREGELLAVITKLWRVDVASAHGASKVTSKA